MEWRSSGHIAHLIATYGLLAIGVIIALESMGFPLPGESVLVLAALYSARRRPQHRGGGGFRRGGCHAR